MIAHVGMRFCVHCGVVHAHVGENEAAMQGRATCRACASRNAAHWRSLGRTGERTCVSPTLVSVFRNAVHSNGRRPWGLFS